MGIVIIRINTQIAQSNHIMLDTFINVCIWIETLAKNKTFNRKHRPLSAAICCWLFWFCVSSSVQQKYTHSLFCCVRFAANVVQTKINNCIWDIQDVFEVDLMNSLSHSECGWYSYVVNVSDMLMVYVFIQQNKCKSIFGTVNKILKHIASRLRRQIKSICFRASLAAHENDTTALHIRSWLTSMSLSSSSPSPNARRHDMKSNTLADIRTCTFIIAWLIGGIYDREFRCRSYYSDDYVGLSYVVSCCSFVAVVGLV